MISKTIGFRGTNHFQTHSYGKSSVRCQGLSMVSHHASSFPNVPCWSILPADQGGSHIFLGNAFGSAHVNTYNPCLPLFSAKQQNLFFGSREPWSKYASLFDHLRLRDDGCSLGTKKTLVVGQELDAKILFGHEIHFLANYFDVHKGYRYRVLIHPHLMSSGSNLSIWQNSSGVSVNDG